MERAELGKAKRDSQKTGRDATCYNQSSFAGERPEKYSGNGSTKTGDGRQTGRKTGLISNYFMWRGEVFTDPNGTIFCDDGEPLVSIRYGEDGRILLSAKIRNEKGELIAEIRDNEWKFNSDLLFDRNYTNFAIEVRERTGNVVLQVADLGDVIHFEGILRCRNGRTFTVGRDERGAVFGFGPNTVSIPEIFEYPSALHFGSCPGYERLRKIEPPIVPGKPFGFLITKPLEICNLPH